MPYDFEPRDLDAPRGERAAREPDDALEAAFEQWQAAGERIPRREIGGSVSQALYDLAVDCLDGVSVRADDASSLLLAHRQSVTPNAGLFLSAAYNRAADDVVFFDVTVPAPPKHLGYRLPAEKTLVLDAPVHSTMALDAAGLVVNRTDVETFLGYSPTGAFVNLGSCLTFGADGAGVAVNLGDVRGAAGSETPIVALGGDEHATCDAEALAEHPALESYLDELHEGLSGERTSVRSFLDGLAPSPRRAIERDLRAHLEA